MLRTNSNKIMMTSLIIRRILFFVLLFAAHITCADEFDTKVTDLLYGKFGNSNNVIEVRYESQNIQNVKSKINDITEISILSFDHDRSTFKVRVQYRDGLFDEVYGKYETFLEVPITSRFIKAGTVVTSEDITITKIKATRIKEQYIINAEDVVGKQAKKNLLAGAFVQSAELARPPVIKHNDPVNITYSSDLIRLKTSGIALGVGAIGDMIKVKNNDTGIVLLGQIINKNTVQVGWADE